MILQVLHDFFRLHQTPLRKITWLAGRINGIKKRRQRQSKYHQDLTTSVDMKLSSPRLISQWFFELQSVCDGIQDDVVALVRRNICIDQVEDHGGNLQCQAMWDAGLLASEAIIITCHSDPIL